MFERAWYSSYSPQWQKVDDVSSLRFLTNRSLSSEFFAWAVNDSDVLFVAFVVTNPGIVQIQNKPWINQIGLLFKTQKSVFQLCGGKFRCKNIKTRKPLFPHWKNQKNQNKDIFCGQSDRTHLRKWPKQLRTKEQVPYRYTNCTPSFAYITRRRGMYNIAEPISSTPGEKVVNRRQTSVNE